MTYGTGKAAVYAWLNDGVRRKIEGRVMRRRPGVRRVARKRPEADSEGKWP